MTRHFIRSFLAFNIIAFSSAPILADDWPTFRHDAERSGYTSTALANPEKLKLSWSHHLADLPRPAWPRSERMTFDRACQTIVADGLVFLGSSVDGSIHALDASTGEPRWIFPTRAPVRFAPAYSNGRIFAVSDDGFLYCLNATDGSLHWKKRGGPGDEMILGNGRMISKWPARGGPVIRDGILYFAAGIWPSDGVSLYAMDPETGKTLWVNDTAGSIYLGQPHGGAFAKSGVAAQGYLVASADQIFMATGRAVPAAFDRKTGDFQYLALQANTKRGGAEVMLSDRFFINGGYAFETKTGDLLGPVGAGPVVVTTEGLAGSFGGKRQAFRWIDKEAIDRKGSTEAVRALDEIYSVETEESGISAIGAGKQTIVGGENVVSLFESDNETEAWRAEVSGNVYGLAIADQRLYVSTDKGIIYCFGTDSGAPVNHQNTRHEKPAPTHPDIAKAAEEIVKQSRISEGYCLDLGCGDAQLAIELAKRTDLFIYGIEPDPQKIAAARKNLIAAGFYGSRVMVFQGDLSDTKLPDYFANLVVSAESMKKALPASAIAEATRVSRPWGGTLATGRPGAIKIDQRGPLEGAGQWTHQYADPANTVNSGDELIHGPLGMLWFSDLEQPMTQRHGRAPAPLFNQGVLYSEGLDTLIAVDAYNGHQLWEYSLPGILDAYDGDHLMGTSGTGSNYCVSDDSVFVRMADHCLKIDAKTGKLISKFKAPPSAKNSESIWGYLAHHEGILFGTLSDPEHIITYRYRPGGDINQQLTESKTFFALNAETGDVIWRYDAKHSLRQNAIAIGNKAIVLIDRPQAVFDRTREGKPDEENHPTGELIAFDTETGNVLWKNSEDIYGTVAAISEEHHSVMMSYQPTSFRLASEVGGRLSVFDLSDGKLKWQTESKYTSRPLINKDTIYAQGGAWDVLTGETRPFNFKRSYGCGILAGARDLLVFRSATLGYFDLTRNQETEDFGGIRPGCWINAIPAGGLVFAPDASAGCKCSYLNQSWIALQPDGLRAPTIDASSPSDPRLVTVNLKSDSPAPQKIRYTLDGSVPSITSPLFHQELKISQSAMLRARAFNQSGRPSPVAEQEFVINPNLVSLNQDLWRVEDSPRASPASEWSIEQGTILQASNVMVGGKPTLKDSAEVERPGSLFVFEEGADFSNGEISFEIRSGDNDALGFVMRYQSPENYYLWSMSSERPYRAIALKNGEQYQYLGGIKAGYQSRTWHEVRIVFEGSKITAFFDGAKDFVIDDATYTKGTVGFYSWGNSGSEFRNLSFFPSE